MGLYRVSTHLVPHDWNLCEKLHHVGQGEEMLSATYNDLKCMIAGHEIQVNTFGPEKALQSSAYRAAGELKPKMKRFKSNQK